MEFPFEISALQKSINESLEYAKNNSNNYLPGENKSLNHQIFEINDYYLGMLEKLKQLEMDDELDQENLNASDEDVSETILSEVFQKLQIKRPDPEIKKQIDKILKLNEELKENYKILNKEKCERKSVQNEICKLLKKEELDRTADKFLELFDEEGDNNVDEVIEDDLIKKSSVDKMTNKNFIKKNIELAKNSTIIGYSLTDEDKIKLEALLEDLDCLNNEDNKNLDINPFNYHDVLSKLEEIDENLKNFESDQVLSIESIEDDERDGKFWKNDQRLKLIEEKLRILQAEEETAVKTKEETVDLDDNLIRNVENLIYFNEEHDVNNENKQSNVGDS